MKEFDTYFNFHNVVNQLIISRSKIAFYIHKNSYLDKFLVGNHFSVKDKLKREEIKTISDLMPPRKEWSRPSKHAYRKKFESSIELNQQSIKNRVYQIHRLFCSQQISFLDSPIWYQNLRKFIFNLRIYVLQSHEIILDTPLVIPARKPPYHKTDIVRRPLAKFKLRDKIIISLTNKYLTKIFDNIFLDSSFAFRSRNSFMAGPTYNDAVVQVKNFRTKNEDTALYVSECDIKKFFDCVDHEVVISTYKELEIVLNAGGIYIDTKANSIFHAYLACYAFNKQVFPLNNEKDYWHHWNDFDGQFGWSAEFENEFNCGNLDHKRIGIPQGGALSGLIVNIIMHPLDIAVTDLNEWNKSYLYLRYCDDMVIIHTSADECKRLFSVYFKNLLTLRLIPHDPPNIKLKYCKEFWGSNIKSRDVYYWSKKTDSNYPHSPWVSFLGYMVNFNGELKIRRSSLDKQISKHNNELVKTIKKLDKISNIDLVNQEFAILRSFETKLISMAVGNVDINNYKKERVKMCWGAGFKLIDNNKFTRTQLKKLDSSRKKKISRLRNYFKSRNIENVPLEKEDDLEILKPEYPHSFFSLLDRPKL